MQKHFIKISKTARYFTFGELTQETQYIWIILHGYAQTAESALQPFKELGSSHFLIAPEGLNKFYLRGLYGEPVASWMTSMEREMEIEDYCNYLDLLVSELGIEKYEKAKIVGLGFSQGVSTLTRFINNTKFSPHFQIMIAGEIAREFQVILPEKIKNTPSLYLLGDKENLIKEGKIEEMKNLLATANNQFVSFEGKHEINESAVEKMKIYLGIN